MFINKYVPAVVGRSRFKMSAPDQLTRLMYSVGFLCSSKQMAGYDFKLGPCHFLIILSVSCHSTL